MGRGMLRFWLACGEYFCLNWHFYKTNKNNVCLTCTLHLVEMKIPSLSTHPHADGKPGEVSQSTKHFWSWTALRNCHEQLTSIENCVKTVENNWKEKKTSNGFIQLGWRNPRLPKTPNRFERALFTPWTRGGAIANAFSLSATNELNIFF